MNEAQTRDELIAAAARDEAEVERALDDLKRAVERPLAVSSRLGEQLARHPLTWLTASVLIGIWMGSRNGARE